MVGEIRSLPASRGKENGDVGRMMRAAKGSFVHVDCVAYLSSRVPTNSISHCRVAATQLVEKVTTDPQGLSNQYDQDVRYMGTL